MRRVHPVAAAAEEGSRDHQGDCSPGRRDRGEHYPRDPDPEIRNEEATWDNVLHMFFLVVFVL